MTEWPESYEPGEGTASAATVGIMIDERFSVLTHRLRPRGRSIVTTELSLDLAAPTSTTIRSLHAQGEILTASEDAALAHAWLRDDAGRLIATAISWCRFIQSGHDENQPFPTRSKTPANLPLAAMLHTRANSDRDAVVATFTPNASCANDQGTLHGGIMTAANLEIGLTWLKTIYPHPTVSSVRLNFLRPVQLTDTVELTGTPVHTGRTLAVAAIVTAATITGAPALHCLGSTREVL